MKIAFVDQSADTIRWVYSPEIRERMKANLGIADEVYTKEYILAHKDEFSDTEYLFTTWGFPAFTVEEIKEYLPSAKAVFYGAGSVQHFAKEFLESGVKVFSAWGANGVPVAEYTVAAIILANKGFFIEQRQIHEDGNYKRAAATFAGYIGNYEAKVGIIGAGMIGKMVISRLRAFNIQTYVFDPFLDDTKAKEMGVKKVSLETLFEECNVITNHLANNDQTAGMLNYNLFSRMKPKSTFINTGRGRQVVEDDLIRMLEEHPDITALLDVTYPEPPVEESKLYTLPNCFMTPHIAGSFGNEVHRMAEYMLEEHRKLVSGEKTDFEVTLKMLETMA